MIDQIGSPAPGGRVLPRPRRGMTLVEVVVASALLLVTIIPILKALTIAQITQRVVERKTRSLLFAQQELERIRARSMYEYDASCEVTAQALPEGFLCTVTDNRDDPQLRLVTVSVGFDHDGDRALDGEETDVSLSTYLARRWAGP